MPEPHPLPSAALAALPHDPRAALCLACAALDAAELRGSPAALSEALAAVARGYRALRQHAAARHHLQQALRWARAAGSTEAVLALLCELAEHAAGGARVAAARPSRRASRRAQALREAARDHVFEASTLAAQLADAARAAAALGSLGAVLAELGDEDDAATLRALARQRLSAAASG